ncbi:MAG: phytoene desaturase family protein [Chloroherpetonaceae bacterium]|nr:phytoene desaturase family protein [Chloroherpetonaceae bacterium]
MRKKVIIIGAGLGGLAAAIRLAHRGYAVQVFERNATVGGKMQELYSPDGCYRFDTGPTLLTMPHVFESLFRDVGKRLSDYLTLVPLEAACKYFFADGSEFTAYCDPQALRQEIARVFPSELQRFERYFQHIQKIYEATAENFIYNPFSFARLFKTNPLRLLEIDALTTVHKRNASFFRDPRLVQFLDRFPTYVGASPYLAPATLNVIPFVELAFGGFYVRGGMYRLAEAYQRLAQEFGAEFHFQQDVKRILVKDGSAVGVELASGERIEADAIISNDDACHLYGELLEGQQTSRRIKALSNLEASCSGFVLCLGIGKVHPHLWHHNIFFSRDYKQEFEEIFTHRVPPSEPTIYITISSKSDTGQAPVGKENWFVLVNAPYLSKQFDWEKQKQAYREVVIQRLKSLGFSDLEKHIEFEAILTPLDLKLRFNAHRGAIYGISSNSRRAAFLRPKNRSPFVKRLYLATGSAHPGGGTPMVTLSGKFAAELLMQDLGG